MNSTGCCCRSRLAGAEFRTWRHGAASEAAAPSGHFAFHSFGPQQLPCSSSSSSSIKKEEQAQSTKKTECGLPSVNVRFVRQYKLARARSLFTSVPSQSQHMSPLRRLLSLEIDSQSTGRPSPKQRLTDANGLKDRFLIKA